LIALGVGARLGPNVAAWAGLSAGPYDGAAVALRSEVRISPRVSARVGGRFGSSAGIGENAVALGLTYRLPWRAAPPPAIGSADTTAH